MKRLQGALQLMLPVFAAGVWPAVLVGCQAPSSVLPSRELRTHLQDERLQVSTSIKGLPLGVRNELEALL